ncbi:MAG: Rne/Rng family ribonuclease, partial [Desulfuromusa sp.]|nr:Rne/Rng family ribonuclease [Desulfuromusa sp.]
CGQKGFNMSKKMLINASHPEENRVAIVVDGILSELDIEIAGQEQSKGNIYKAVVVRVETGLQAAFVDYGAEKLGFLQIGEVHTKLYPPKDETKGRPRIADILQRGQEILVQIVKEERGNKGAALTTFLSIPGRYMVLMPDSTTKGVSRKISVDSERRSLKKTMAELDLPERMGYIVRTAGIGKDQEELKRDFDYLVRLFEGIVARKDDVKAPAQLYQESNLAIRSIRDYFSTEMDEVLIDDHKVFQDTKDFFSLVMPELKHLVKRHRERRPIFSRYQIEEQIDGLAKNQAPLPSGGSIVIDQTEALVAIDVNSGKMSGESGIEATAYKTNLEAATEVGRQLRLRDLGGLVVIDFIDMRDRKNIREIEQTMRKALKDDKAKVSVGRISQFGLLEMSRQRLKPVLSVGAYLECPHCKGIGRIKSIEAQAVAFLRQAHTAAAKGQIAHIEANVPLDVANYLLNQKRATITELERQLKLKISLFGRVDILPGDIQLELHKRETETETPRQTMPVSHDNQIENALAAQQTEQQTEKPTEEQPEETVDGTDTKQDNGEEPAEKSKKRRRRRRKKPAVATQEQTDQQTQEEGETPLPEPQQPAVAEQPADATEKTHEETTETATEKPKPRRRGRRRSPAKKVAEEKTTAGQETDSTETDVTPNQHETPATTETQPVAPTSEEKPKRQPRRNTRKAAPVNNMTTAETVKSQKPSVKSSESELTVEEKPAEKPKRRPRRTTKKVVEELSESKETAARESKGTEEKPKRRTRQTTKKTTKPIVQGSDANQLESGEAKKPQPNRRQTPKKTSEKQAETPGSGEAMTKEESKPKRRVRKTTKKTAEETPDKIATTAQEETTAVEKPKRRTRKAPVKKKPVEPESPAK